MKCPECNGEGILAAFKDSKNSNLCPRCGGTGITAMETLEEYQTVTLVLNGGIKTTWFGRVQMDPTVEVKVTEILVSLPKKLPPGCKFETLEDKP